MSLIVFNGSPRGEKSNSSIITSWFLNGYDKENVEIRFLKKFKQHDLYIEEMTKHDQVLMVFPLYVDGMPGQVKHFFESFIPYKEKLKNKKITYIIHSGFSDGIQSKVLEQYLNRFSKLMSLENHGIIIIPGSEGFRLMPPSMTKNKSQAVANLGSSYKANKPYNKEDINYLYGEDRPTESPSFMLKVFNFLGLTNMYWNKQLKNNKVYKNRFDAPYKDNPTKITTDAYITNKQEIEYDKNS